MGKQGRGAYQGQWSDAAWQSSPAWSVWPGAWPRRGQKDGGAKGHGKQRFPSYDADWEEQGAHITVVEERRMQPAATPTLSNVVQQTVNASRKAEQRVAKLKKAITSKEEKWRAYQIAMKAAYNREQQRCEKDQQRLQAELASAMQEEEEAHQLLATAAAEYAKMGKDAPSGDSEWEQFLGRSTAPVENSMQSLSRQLEEAIHRRQQAVDGPQQGSRPAPGLPRPEGHVTTTSAPNPPVPPPTYDTRSPARSGGEHPFGSSEDAEALHAAMPTGGVHPACKMIDKRTSPLHPGQRRPGEARQPTSQAPPRAGVKPATMKPAPPEPPHSTLTDKLATRRALRPFGKPPDGVPAEATGDEQHAAKELSLQYDDGSGEEQEILDAPMSPGLGELG